MISLGACDVDDKDNDDDEVSRERLSRDARAMDDESFDRERDSISPESNTGNAFSAGLPFAYFVDGIVIECAAVDVNAATADPVAAAAAADIDHVTIGGDMCYLLLCITRRRKRLDFLLIYLNLKQTSSLLKE